MALYQENFVPFYTHKQKTKASKNIDLVME